jgi:hypothetical protein
MSRPRCVNCGAPIKKPIGHALCEKCWVERLRIVAERLSGDGASARTPDTPTDPGRPAGRRQRKGEKE